MGTTAGVGFSDHRNPSEAGKQAALQAMAAADTAQPDFVFVFATVGYDQQQLIDAIRATTAGAALSGCSGEGIITRDRVVETNFAVAVMVLKSDEVRFDNLYVRGEGGAVAEQAGQQLAHQLQPVLAADSSACFLFVDGLVFNHDAFRTAFETTLCRDHPLPLFGGLAADNWASHKTFQYHNDEVFSEGVSAVLISGTAELAWGINHGCLPVGSQHTITRCHKNIIYEIDGIPALDALKDYFADGWQSQWNKTSLNLCLGFKTPDHIRAGYEEYVIRYMMGMNLQEGYVTLQAEVQEGSCLWIVRRDKELIRRGLLNISRQIKEKAAAKKPKFILQFECVGRGKVVFREQEKVELIKSLQAEIGADIPWIGVYTYGEIGPILTYKLSA